MIILATRRGVLRRKPLTPATFIGATVTNTTPGAPLAKPAGTVAGDFMMVFGPYGGSSISGGSGGWAHDTFTSATYGYDNHAWWKVLTAADISASLTLNSVQYGPVICVVYRGPTTAFKMSQAESTNPANTLDFARAAKNGASLGQVQYVNDRDGAGVPSGPSGFVMRSGPNGTGIFTGSVADLITGAQPAAAGTDTWTGFNGGYPQVGFSYELRG